MVYFYEYGSTFITLSVLQSLYAHQFFSFYYVKIIYLYIKFLHFIIEPHCY